MVLEKRLRKRSKKRIIINIVRLVFVEKVSVSGQRREERREEGEKREDTNEKR